MNLGFEQAGYEVGPAYDIRAPAIDSHNHCLKNKSALVRDVLTIELEHIDKDFGAKFCPNGVIGAPPCQSFSRANSSKKEKDPRTKMVKVFFDMALKIHDSRDGLDFIVMENVPEVSQADGGRLLKKEIDRLKRKILMFIHLNTMRPSMAWLKRAVGLFWLQSINSFLKIPGKSPPNKQSLLQSET